MGNWKEKAPFPLKSHYSEIKIFNLLVSILLDISLGINTQDGCIIVSFISNISMSVNIEIHYFFYLQIISKHNMFDFCCFIWSVPPFFCSVLSFLPPIFPPLFSPFLLSCSSLLPWMFPVLGTLPVKKIVKVLLSSSLCPGGEGRKDKR